MYIYELHVRDGQWKFSRTSVAGLTEAPYSCLTGSLTAPLRAPAALFGSGPRVLAFGPNVHEARRLKPRKTCWIKIM